ncbi:pVI [Falcon aviadenovirus A]|nr:pVI [Falcon aviadenovirus A]
MDYASLSPHVGSWSLRDEHLGDSSLRGGAINWGNIGSRLSSALSSTGRWLYNAGNRFVHSNTFNQIKQGIKDSGVIKNAANLAGETINALTDIGRLKLQQDLEKLRRKALGEEGPPPNTAELQALIAALQAQVANQSASQPTTMDLPPPPLVPTTRPIPEMVTPVLPPVASSGPSLPVDTPTTLEYHPSIPKRRRKRPGNWRGRLSSMTGSGVTTKSRRVCY